MQASRHSKYLQPNQSRRRQFQQIRTEHSHNSRAASRSQQRSLKSQFMHKIDYNKQPKTPVAATHKKIANRRTRQDDNTSQRQFASKSATKLLCVGCFNHQLFEAKRRKKNRQHKQQQQRQRYNNSVDQFNAQQNLNKTRYARQYQKTNLYNLNKIQQNTLHKKQGQRRMRQQNARIRYEEELDNRKRFQLQTKINQEKRQKIRQELEQQIKKRKARLIQQQIQKKKVVQPIFNQYNRNQIKSQKQQSYKRQLLRQIYEDKQRKRQMERQQKYRNSQEANLFAEQAVQREKIKIYEAERRRISLLQQARKRKQEQQRKRIQQSNKRKQEQKIRIILLEEERQLSKEKQAIKHIRANEHLKNLKKQIQFQTFRKKQEQQFKTIPMGTIFSEKQIIDRQCDSCQKRFPRQYLTKVVQPFEV